MFTRFFSRLAKTKTTPLPIDIQKKLAETAAIFFNPKGHQKIEEFDKLATAKLASEKPQVQPLSKEQKDQMKSSLQAAEHSFKNFSAY